MKRLLVFTLVVALTFQLCYGIEQTVSKDQAVFNVDEMPKFKGKDLTYFRAWVQHNIKRPKVVKKDDIAGRVLLSFIVERDGSLSDIKVIQSVNEHLSEEAIRVVKSSPKWTPGKHQGELMRVKYIVPIDFRHAKLKHYTLRLNSPDATVNEGMVTIRQKTKADSIEIDKRRKEYAEQRKGFGSMIDASATLGLFGKPRLCGGLSYIAGYRFNNQLFLGGGVGVNQFRNAGFQNLRWHQACSRRVGQHPFGVGARICLFPRKLHQSSMLAILCLGGWRKLHNQANRNAQYMQCTMQCKQVLCKSAIGHKHTCHNHTKCKHRHRRQQLCHSILHRVHSLQCNLQI